MNDTMVEKENITITKKKVAGSFMWKLLERVFSQGLNLVVQIILARILLPKDFGDVAIIVAFVNYAALFVQSGLGTAIVQKKDLDKLDVQTLMTASLSIALIFYIILFFGAPIIGYYFGDTLIWPIRIQSIVLFLNAINSIQTAVLARKLEFKKIFLKSALAIPISGAVGIIMAYSGFGVWSIVIQNIVNMSVVVIVMMFGTLEYFKLRFSLKKAKEMYSFSWKILLTSLVTGFSDMMRTMVIGKKYSKDELAYYDKAYTYSAYINNIVNASVSTVMLSAFSRKQDNLESLKKMSRTTIGLSAVIMFPILFGIMSISSELVYVLLTEKWMECVPFLIIFCILRMPSCIVSTDKQVYYALGKSGINLIYEIVFFVSNIGLLLFTMNFGTIYIALGAMSVELIGGIAISVISAKVYKYTLLERLSDLIKPLSASLIMFLVLKVFELLIPARWLLLLVKIFAGVVIYVLLLILLKDSHFFDLVNFLKRLNNRKNK